MPTTNSTAGRIILLCFGALVTLWLLGFFDANHVMDSIPSPFTVEINGKPITRPDEHGDDPTQARTGNDAAVFVLENSQLKSGDWIVGRNLTENRSFGPKKVSWYRAVAENAERVQAVTASKEGDSYRLIFTKGTLMVGDEDRIFVDLIGETNDEVKVILKKE